MKSTFFLLIATLCCLMATAQRKDTTVLLKLPPDPVTVARFKQKLVELALANPKVNQHNIRREINKYETRQATSKWLDYISVAGNLNEFTIKNQASTNNFYPRYNFGIMIPLGSLVSIPNGVKIAKANGRLIDAEKQSESLQLKSKVLRAYEDYAADKQLVELHTPMMEDALFYYNQAEEKFKAGDKDVPLAIYKEAYGLYNSQMVKKVQLERDLRQAKLALEELVGITLEEVMLQL